MRDLAQAAGPAREILFDAALKPVPHWRKIMESAPSLVEFKGLFKRYIDEYGHLGSGTIDLAAKNWRDEPGRVLELAGELMASGEAHGGKAYLALLTNKRNKIVESLSKRLSFFHRLKLRLLLGLMVEAAPFRENVKFYMFRRIGIIRVLLLEAARRLKEKGLLCSEEDIFFLKSDELKDLLTAKSSSFSPGEISRRRGEHWRNLRMACPIFRVEGGKGARLYFASPARGKREFQGVAASAGAVAGKARVILALEEAGRLRPGEILVTMTTDPSWTPLFSVASGVVVEVGSILSHGAVVAREIGIPAVMGLPGIVSAVRDGDSLFVDGSTGMVRWIQDSEESGVENSRG
jgi:pyruvate,water dikinase